MMIWGDKYPTRTTPGTRNKHDMFKVIEEACMLSALYPTFIRFYLSQGCDLKESTANERYPLP